MVVNLKNRIAFLRSVELFSDCTEAELKSLAPLLEDAIFNLGDWIIREGEMGQQIYLLKWGRAEIIKEKNGQVQHLGYLEKGDWVGEMAYLEKEKRSASIQALEKVEVVILPIDKIQYLPDKDLIYSRIMVRLAKRISQRLRKTGESLSDTMKEKIAIMQSSNQLAKTIIHVFILLSAWFNISKLMYMFPLKNREIIDPTFTAILLLLFGASTVYIIKTSHYPLFFYGLTISKWPKVCLDAILCTIPILIFLVFLKWILVNYIGVFKGIPIFSSKPADISAKDALIFGAIYMLLIPIQELVARGGLQSCLRNFLQGPDRVFMAILISNILFEVIHLVKSFWLAIGTFFLGLFWGFLFERQKSLIGVCLSHLIVGGWAFYILDIQTLIVISNH